MLSRCAKPSHFPKNKINIILVLFVRGELSRGLKMFGKTVIIKRGTKEVYLMELTVQWDCASNMVALVQRKTERYQGLASAIEENGYKCFNTSLEIGTREVINHRNWAVINLLCLVMKIKKINNLITTCSKLALLGSYTLLNARYSTDWSFGGHLKP